MGRGDDTWFAAGADRPRQCHALPTRRVRPTALPGTDGAWSFFVVHPFFGRLGAGAVLTGDNLRRANDLLQDELRRRSARFVK